MTNHQLNRQIAEKVFGEPEPPPLRLEPGIVGDIVVDANDQVVNSFSEGGNWVVTQRYEHGDKPEWEPVDFSGRLEEAERAVDKVYEKVRARRVDAKGFHHRVHIQYIAWDSDKKPEEPYLARLPHWGESCRGRTLPEAICYALLAYIDRREG